MIYKPNSLKETQKIAFDFAESLALKKTNSDKALVICLQGDLGAGKTSFSQGFLKFFGIKKVSSPTFVIMKTYNLKKPIANFKNIYHLDCYRLKSEKDLTTIGFKEALQNKNGIILIEWPERIKKVLPKSKITIDFKYGEKENQRKIVLKK